MPVVKNFDFNAAPPPQAPDASSVVIERVTTMDNRRNAFDHHGDQGHEPLHGGVGLYVWLFVIAGVLARLMLAALGPGTDPTLVMTPDVTHHLALADTLIDHHAFGLPLTDADVVTPTLNPAFTLEQAGHNFEQLRRIQGETGGVFPQGIKPQASTLPGVPAILAALTLAGIPLNALILAQCVIGGLLAWPAFIAVGGAIKRRAPAMLAAALLALHPAMITAALTPDGTLWVTVALVLGLLTLTQTFTSSALRAAAGGMLVGLAALIQPWVFFAAPAFALFRILQKRSAASWGMAAAFVLVAAMPPAAWMYRNHMIGVGIVMTTDARIDRALGIPANLATQDADGPHHRDRPAAIAALWDAFAQQAEQEKETATTTATLARFARSHWFTQPAATLRYAAARAKTLAFDHSAETLLPSMGLTYQPAGTLAGLIGEATTPDTPDPVARWITEVWIALNLALAAAAVVGLVVSIVRRNFAIVALVLGVSVMWLVFTPSTLGEAARLPLIIVQAVAITAMWMPAAPKRIKAPKQKAGDFAAIVPDAGFTIGPRDRVAGSAPPLSTDTANTPDAQTADTPEPVGRRPI